MLAPPTQRCSRGSCICIYGEDGSSPTCSCFATMSGMKYARPEAHLRQNHTGENPFMKLNHPNANDIPWIETNTKVWRTFSKSMQKCVGTAGSKLNNNCMANWWGGEEKPSKMPMDLFWESECRSPVLCTWHCGEQNEKEVRKAAEKNWLLLIKKGLKNKMSRLQN